MKLNEAPNLPILNPPTMGTEYDRRLTQALLPWMREAARKLNGLASGNVSARDSLATAAPITGTWAAGDEVKNSAPAELGSTGSKYVIDGWKCVAAGTPGTWVQRRFLTGN